MWYRITYKFKASDGRVRQLVYMTKQELKDLEKDKKLKDFKSKRKGRS